MKKLFLLVGLVVFSFSAKSEEYFCESKKNGNVYKSPVGCFNNITLTEEEFLSKSDKLIEYTPATFVFAQDENDFDGHYEISWELIKDKIKPLLLSRSFFCGNRLISNEKFKKNDTIKFDIINNETFNLDNRLDEFTPLDVKRSISNKIILPDKSVLIYKDFKKNIRKIKSLTSSPKKIQIPYKFSHHAFIKKVNKKCSDAFLIKLTFLGEIEQKTKTTITQSKLPKCKIGEFKKACYGTIVTSNGNKYVGEIKDGSAHGQGSVSFHNGNKYIGEFENGKMQGQGSAYFNNRNRYIGEFRNNLLHGKGTYYFKSGNKYIGEFKNGKRNNGQGTKIWWNGDNYVGEWKDKKRHGQGTMVWTAASWNTGKKYVGEWKDGKRHGKGTMSIDVKSENSSRYVGDWEKGKMHGQGILYVKSWASGGKYIGEWKENKMFNVNYIKDTDTKSSKNSSSQENVGLLNNEQVRKTKIQTKSQKKKGFFGDLASMGGDLLSGNFKGAKGQRQYSRENEPSGYHTQEASGPNNRQVRVNQQGQQMYNPILEDILNGIGFTQINPMREEILNGFGFTQKWCAGTYQGGC